MSNFCIAVSRTTELFDSAGENAYGDWEGQAVETETIWYSPDGNDWKEGDTRYIQHLTGTTETNTVTYEDELATMHDALQIYQGDWDTRVAYWFVDGSGIQRSADASELSNLPAEVVSALNDIQYPTPDEASLLRQAKN